MWIHTPPPADRFVGRLGSSALSGSDVSDGRFGVQELNFIFSSSAPPRRFGSSPRARPRLLRCLSAYGPGGRHQRSLQESRFDNPPPLDRSAGCRGSSAPLCATSVVFGGQELNFISLLFRRPGASLLRTKNKKKQQWWTTPPGPPCPLFKIKFNS